MTHRINARVSALGILIFLALLASSQTKAQDHGGWNGQWDPEEFSEEPPALCVNGTLRYYGGGFKGDFGGSGDPELDWDYVTTTKLSPEPPRKHLVIGHEERFKAGGRFGFDRSTEAYFYDSAGGYRGSDRSDNNGNSYLTYEVTGEQLAEGETWFWVMRHMNELHPLCAKTRVYFQEHTPNVEVDVVDATNDYVRIDVDVEIDPNSKRGRQHLPATIDIYRTEFVSSVNGQCVFKNETSRVYSNASPGLYTIRANECNASGMMTIEVKGSDGVYSNRQGLGGGPF